MGSFALDLSAGNGGACKYVVNDNVMGGVFSQGGWMASDEWVWRTTSPDASSMRNNGGFSSVRTRVPTASLVGYDGIEMRVRGDGTQIRDARQYG